MIWHMPWAYQGDSTHAEFPKYDRDQQKMYETIVARAQEIILPEVAAYLSAIREAVKGAMANNFSVTQSKIETAEDGFDLSGYELLEWNYNKNG